MREASEITSRDASEQILALIRVGYTVLTYPRVFPARFYLPIRRRHSNPLGTLAPSLTRISTPFLSAPCIFGSAGNSTFPSVRVNSCEATRFIALAFRSLVNHLLPKRSAFAYEIFVRNNICNISGEREIEGGGGGRERKINSFYESALLAEISAEKNGVL